MSEITVNGSNGDFIVSSRTGGVLTPMDEMPDEYRDIIGVDLLEWVGYWKEPPAE